MQVMPTQISKKRIKRVFKMYRKPNHLIVTGLLPPGAPPTGDRPRYIPSLLLGRAYRHWNLRPERSPELE